MIGFQIHFYFEHNLISGSKKKKYLINKFQIK